MKETTVLLGMGGATSKGREMFTAEFIRGALVQLQNEVENNELLEVERSGLCPIVAGDSTAVLHDHTVSYRVTTCPENL